MSWITRSLSWLASPFRRAAPVAVIEERPDLPTVSVGSGVAVAQYSSGPAYSVPLSMTAFAAFPLVFAASTVKAEDMGGLPLIVTGPDGRVLPPSDPISRLLRRPTVRGSGVLLRQQLVVDLVLTGTAYARVVGSDPRLFSFVRLHPAECTIAPWPDGQPGRVTWRSGSVEITMTPGENVIVIRAPSFRAGGDQVYGTGAIEVLHQTLSVERAAFSRARESLEQGRPSMIARPIDARPDPTGGHGLLSGGSAWKPEVIAEIQKALGDLFRRASGGVAVVSQAMDLTTPQWSTADLQALEVSEASTMRILAALKVPPARLGLAVANQQPARDQDRVYWQGLIALAALVDDALSNWIDSVPGYEGSTIYHDFAGVRAAQFPQDGAIARAVQLVAIGVDPRAALASQGIDLPAGAFAAPGTEDDPDDDPAMDGEPPADMSRPRAQGAQMDPVDAPDPEGLQALARLLAGGRNE